MVISSHPQPPPSPQLLKFITQKLGVSENAVNLGIKQSNVEQAPLPIILWTFGLITLKQYQEILDFENSCP